MVWKITTTLLLTLIGIRGFSASKSLGQGSEQPAERWQQHFASIFFHCGHDYASFLHRYLALLVFTTNSFKSLNIEERIDARSATFSE